jgi:hypothetical protein
LVDDTLLGPEFGQNGKETITTLNLLLHNAGFPPDPVPGYSIPLSSSSFLGFFFFFPAQDIFFLLKARKRLDAPKPQIIIHNFRFPAKIRFTTLCWLKDSSIQLAKSSFTRI